MTKHDFNRILKTFVDPGVSIISEASTICFSVAGNSYFLYTKGRNGELEVSEQEVNGYIPASSWIIRNLAHLDLLARRIVDLIPEPKNFISPSLILNFESETTKSTKCVIEHLRDYVSDRTGAFQTNLLYLVSNAGEGKSTILSKFAIDQARKYINREAEWLLLPIPLGGRPFLRFDDITVGVLQNKYRFQYLYYDSFIELVKLGLIIPAFDGFEEMFVETSSHEAFSAMSTLVESLDSSGTMIVAARKAYFDFDNIRIKESIIDNIREKDVSFDKFEILKWDKEHFIEYAKLCAIYDPESLYERIFDALLGDKTHPILTRPVFVKKLLEICDNSDSQDDFVTRIRSANTNVIRAFLESIVERESLEKWIDRSGSDGIESSLITNREHFELLSMIALMLWESQKDSLELKALEFLARYFAETHRKTAEQANKIVARLPSHALITKCVGQPSNSQQYSFEHESFWMFFLGFGIYLQLEELEKSDSYLNLRNTLRFRLLNIEAIHSILLCLNEKDEKEKRRIIEMLVQLCAYDDKTSFTQDNSSNIIIRLLSNIDFECKSISNISFPVNALRSRKLKNVVFRNCYFAATAVKNSQFSNCIFQNCIFEVVKFAIGDDETPLKWIQSELIECDIHAIETESNFSLWNPEEIYAYLIKNRYITENEDSNYELHLSESSDEKLICLEKLLRYFMRSTHISDSIIKMKIGEHYTTFEQEVLPYLLKVEVLEMIPNRSGSSQHRYRLGLPLAQINDAISKAYGKFEVFLTLL